jgi:hypothetical protein
MRCLFIRLGVRLLPLLVLQPAAAAIRIEINGVDADLRRNVEALLSLERYKERERLEADAVQRLYRRVPGEVRDALRPFGYYAPKVESSITSDEQQRNWRVQISIDPGLIGSEANPGARLTIGQDLTRSLRLVYSMNLTNSNDQIWILQYDFSRRFTGKAVQQSDNTYRVQFTHELRFGGVVIEPGGLSTTGGIFTQAAESSRTYTFSLKP